MTKKEVVNTIRTYVSSTIKAQGFSLSAVDQRELIEDIEADLGKYVDLYSVELDTIETTNELED